MSPPMKEQANDGELGGLPKVRLRRGVRAEPRLHFGKALGWGIALGPMGLVAGAHGNKKIIITCLSCGHSWVPGEAASEEPAEDKPAKDEDFSHIL